MLFFGGFLAGLIVFWILIKIYLHRYEALIKDGIEVYEKLDELFKNCQDIAVQTMSELESKIDKVNKISQEVEKSEDKTPQRKAKKEISKYVEKKSDFEIPPQYLSILRLKEAGWEIKEIAKEVAMGQDQVAMIIQLFYHQKP